MNSTYRRILVALAALCLMFGLAACGDDDDGGGGGGGAAATDDGGKAITKDPGPRASCGETTEWETSRC